MWKLTEWNEYAVTEDAIDISVEVTSQGYIPVECPNSRCKAKLFDVETRRIIKQPVPMRGVYCTLCGYEGYRFVAKKRG